MVEVCVVFCYCRLYGKCECRADVVSCVHPVTVLNAAFCMTCSLLMLVEDARGDHMQQAYPRYGHMTAL